MQESLRKTLLMDLLPDARQAEPQGEEHAPITVDEGPPVRRCKANWARLIQKLYEVDPPTVKTAFAFLRRRQWYSHVNPVLTRLGHRDRDSYPSFIPKQLGFVRF